ncbi:MAG TPA: uroporphyrinogen-III C-methyltransferase [Noviherbaspirillum sp.]|nr:uroporphyrinogen-III C-methyltransferase [Noviherbaspirillum sp.]
MNEQPSTSNVNDDKRADAGAAPESAPAPAPAPVTPSSARPVHQVLFGAVILLAALLLAQWWVSQREISGLREDVAQRLRTGETAQTEARVVLKSLQDDIKGVHAKVNVIESRQSEAQAQQLALEQLYQELARTRDDWTLSEIEQILTMASQQLQLAGNVQGAIIALQNADARLARADTQQLVRVRRAIAGDLERLQALPSVDLTGIALRLDSVIGQIDAMPLLADEKPALPATEPKIQRRSAPVEGEGNADWLARIENAWHSWTSEMWTEIKQVIRVRNVETSDALLLSPTQSYYARENLKLRLLNARLALMTRNENVFRNDLIAAQDAIARYFDTRARQTQNVQAMLRQVQASQLAIELPTLADSLNAVRSYKATN